MSYRRKRVIQREKNKELRENKAKLAAEAKEAVKKARADGKAAVARVKDPNAVFTHGSKDQREWGDLAPGIAERAKLRRGVPAQGVDQVGGSSGSGLVR